MSRYFKTMALNEAFSDGLAGIFLDTDYLSGTLSLT